MLAVDLVALSVAVVALVALGAAIERAFFHH